MITREELKEHCKRQIEECKRFAKARGVEPSGKIYEEHKLGLELLEQEPKWIPVKDPLKELPKDKPLLVTVKDVDSFVYVTELYYDMTEWSDINNARGTIAYQYKPEPYNPEKEE